MNHSFRETVSRIYESVGKGREAQKRIGEVYGVSDRTVRRWIKKMNEGELNNETPRVLIYDIETCRVPAMVWWSGKQFVRGDQLTEEPRIITVAWKWLEDEKVSHLTWDKNQSDESLVEEFIKIYNSADMVVGVNNNNFDNRWIQARAIKYGLPVNMHVKSLDLQKQMKKVARIPSYSMKSMGPFLRLDSLKLEHEGIKMWDMIQTGNKQEREEYLAKMVEYNVGDIMATEEWLITVAPYINLPIHLGALKGNGKSSCKFCGSSKLSLVKKTTTSAGTEQYILSCDCCKNTQKVSKNVYFEILDANGK